MPEKKAAARKSSAVRKSTAGKKTTKKTSARKTGARKTGARKKSASKGRRVKAAPVTPEVEKAAESGPVRLRITQTRSPIGRPRNQKLTLQALGLRRIGHSVEHDGTPSIRGMVNTVVHLVRVEQIR
jgi:large subunit ribosomal protein L30